MGEIVEFISKSERERLRLIREARAIYDSIFPPNDAASERTDDRAGKDEARALIRHAPSKPGVRLTDH